jgi:uncharacterized protein
MKNLHDISLSDNDRRAIEDAANILRERFPVEEIVLYGSKARGTDDSESDIDLLVITSFPVSWRERRSITDSLFDLQIERGVVISPLVISRDEWSNGVYQVLPIRREIERDGAAA